MRICPECEALIPDKSIKCPRCKKDIPPLPKKDKDGAFYQKEEVEKPQSGMTQALAVDGEIDLSEIN